MPLLRPLGNVAAQDTGYYFHADDPFYAGFRESTPEEIARDAFIARVQAQEALDGAPDHLNYQVPPIDWEKYNEAEDGNAMREQEHDMRLATSVHQTRPLFTVAIVGVVLLAIFSKR